MTAFAPGGKALPRSPPRSLAGRADAMAGTTASARAPRASCIRMLHLAEALCRDRNPLHLALRLRALPQGDGQHAILEADIDLVRIDIRAERQGTLELAMPAL